MTLEFIESTTMSKGLIDLISILDLEPIEVNMFRGNSPKTSWQRVFGGQVIGQAMVAACRTVEGRLPHSLHCYFILPGDPQIPIIYEVERLRDGKSYSTRRVTAIQHGNAIFSIMVSFHAEEEGAFDHQDKMPDVPPPEKLTAEEVAKQPMFREMPEFIRRYYESDRPIELRPVELGRYFGEKIDDGRINVWIRTAAKLPDDPALHMCALAYASDFSLLDAVMARYGRTLFDKQMMPASLDHAMWFHRPFRADEWLLYAQDSPSAQRGRGIYPRPIVNPPRPHVGAGGLPQRAALARALPQRPAIVLADEPTGALDTATSVEVQEILVRQAAAGQAIVVVTHDPLVAARAERIVLLRDGRIEDELPPTDAATIAQRMLQAVAR